MTAMQTRPRPPARRTSSLARRVLLAAIGLTVLAAALVVGAGRLTSGGDEPRSAGTGAVHDSDVPAPAPDPAGAPAGEPGLPDDPRLRDDRVDPFDEGHPSVAGLAADLRAALQAATREAAADGVRLWVTSGWRSTAYQEELLAEAVARYGTLTEALRYVALPEASRHVTGDAVDIGPREAGDWMSQHGAEHGLCQTYANEWWHFELTVEPGGTCPAPRPDAAG